MNRSPRRRTDPLLAGAGLKWVTIPVLATLLLIATWPLAIVMTPAHPRPDFGDDSRRALLLLLNSVGVIALVVATALPLGTCLGAALFRFRFPARRLALLFVCLFAFRPLVLLAGGWLALFGPDGPLTIAKGNYQGSRWALVIVAAIHSLWAIPWVALIVGSSLNHVDPDLESAALLEAPAGRVFLSVTLRLTRPALVFAALVAAAPVLVDMTVTDLFQVRTFAEEVYTRFEVGGDEPMATFASLPVSLVATLLLVWAARHWLTSASVEPRSISLLPDDNRTRLLTSIAAVTLGLLVLPTLGFLWQLGLEGSITAGGGMHWSGSTAARFLARELTGGIAPIIQTLFLAALASALATGAALVLAWQWRWRSLPLQRLGLSLASWLYLLPGPVLGLTLIDLCNRPSPLDLVGRLYDSPAIVVLGQALRIVPAAWLLLCAWLATADRSEFEAAALEGAGGWAVCVHIAAPRLLHPLLVAFLAGTALAVAELPVTKFVAPPGLDLLSPRIFHLLHSGTQNQQAALALILEAMILLFASLAILAMRFTQRSRQP